MSKAELMRKIGTKFGEGQRLSTSFAMISMRKVLAEDDDGWDVEAEVFGSGGGAKVTIYINLNGYDTRI